MKRSLQGESGESLYSNRQELTLIVTPYFSACLSVLGSGLILYVILNERSRTFKETYHRLMFGLSAVNFLNALSIIVFGHWAVNADLVDYPGASGNSTTCSIAGFFLNFVFGSMWYSFFLALSSALKIQCDCKNKCIRNWCESFAHFFGCIYPIISGASTATEQHINPLQQLPGWCWITDFPNGCGSNPDIQCLRGEGYVPEMSIGTILLLFIGIVVCMALIVTKVWKIESRMRNYAGTRNDQLWRTRQTCVQALWYIGVFLIVYSPVVAVMALGNNFYNRSRGVYFGFALMTKLLTPLRGFLDAIVYFRTRFRALLQNGRALSFLSMFFGNNTQPFNTSPVRPPTPNERPAEAES